MFDVTVTNHAGVTKRIRFNEEGSYVGRRYAVVDFPKGFKVTDSIGSGVKSFKIAAKDAAVLVDGEKTGASVNRFINVAAGRWSGTNDTEDKVMSKANKKQVGGDHYTKMNLQPLEACYLRYGYEGLKAAVHTKVDKYIDRDKDNEVEQLGKAIHCLELLRDKAIEEQSIKLPPLTRGEVSNDPN